jgi:hypothetical protein
MATKAWHPTDVAAVRNGYWWVPNGISGLGGSSFKLIEQNQHSSFDCIQATVSQQPSVITAANGNTQLRFAVTGDQRTKTAGSVTSGWSGNTYLGMWYRLPNGTPNNGTSTIFAHQTASNGLRRITVISNGTTNSHQLNLSADGTTVQSDIWADQGDSEWYWHEWIYTAGVGADHYRNLSVVTHTTTAINLASLNDPSVPLAIGAGTAAGVNVNDQDVGPVFYCNGIPTLAERGMLARHAPPVAVSF